ncbi:hypothetical protein SDC9_115076 [bioreactor metagenome]|uniref:Uncharacterized protein n=1 Tax=bioreactor metagenome TaxID=1076179 RepID=A0A645BS40_9ZZZZ
MPTRIALGPQDSLRAASGESTPVLSRYERYVQAQLDASVLRGDSFIVRWRKADSGETMELTAQGLPPQTQGQAQGVPLWMHSSIDWPPGDYMVEVLAPDASLELLARGEFRIAAESEGVTPFAYAVLNAR